MRPYWLILRKPKISLFSAYNSQGFVIEMIKHMQKVSASHIAFASFIGTAIEFYDFYIYAMAAALVIGQVFFLIFFSIIGRIPPDEF